jgi:hypothetical protein
MNKISIKVIFPLILISLTTLNALQGQLRDTVLNMVISKPNFYNVIKSGDDRIFAGTSEGIFEIKGVNLSHYGSNQGYLTIDKKGNPIIDSNGVKYYSEKKYAHLLPYPELAREEYHTSNGNTFYICSGGRLYIYDIFPYEYSYPNHSFRTISNVLLGTYSGIYLKGKKMSGPIAPFTDGYIRQFGDRAFICNYEILILEKDALDSGKIIEGKNKLVFNPYKESYNDIFPSKDLKHYYVATQTKVIRVDYDFKNYTTIFEYEGKNGPIGFITEGISSLLFFANNNLFQISYENEKVYPLTTFNEQIMAGVVIEKQTYVLTSKGLYRFNTGQQLEKLIDIEKAHTMISLSGSELIIGSDHGLYLFNIVNRELSVIIKGIEFNRKALHKNENAIYAGSINGLYTIQSADIPILIEDNKSQLTKATASYNLIGIAAAIALIIILFIVIVLRFRKKLKAAEDIIEQIKSPKEIVTREKIEEFILNNLPNASIKTIMEEFKLNAQQVYAILKPDKPGSIIQQIRLETLKKMRAEKKKNLEISEVTGLSVSYLKKLKG